MQNFKTLAKIIPGEKKGAQKENKDKREGTQLMATTLLGAFLA
jgi:hypothetical protein